MTDKDRQVMSDIPGDPGSQLPYKKTSKLFAVSRVIAGESNEQMVILEAAPKKVSKSEGIECRVQRSS